MPNGALHAGAAQGDAYLGERFNYVSIRFFLIFIDLSCQICFYGWYGWYGSLRRRFETQRPTTPKSLGNSEHG